MSVDLYASPMGNPFKRFNISPEVIRLAVIMYVRYSMLLRNAIELLAERGIDICHETVRLWWSRFGPIFATAIKKRGIALRHGCPEWRWHLDEVFVNFNGITHYLWRAVDHEGEVLEVVATKKRNRRAALKFLRDLMRRYGRARSIVIDRLRAYAAALKAIGATHLHECRGRWIHNHAQTSHQTLRRRERSMLRFCGMRTLQKVTSIHAAVHNHFNHECHLVRGQTYRLRRSAAMAGWGALMV